MKKYRDYLHPIFGIVLGYNWISLFDGLNFPIWQQLIVVTIFNGLTIGFLAAIYEILENKLAEAIPSELDVLWSAIGGSIGGCLWVLFPNLVIMPYLLIVIALGGVYDVYKMIKK
jgi:hypothetical protein